MEPTPVTTARRRTLLIGVDGGASGFRAFEIVERSTPEGPRLALGAHSGVEDVEPVAGFVPRPLALQREEARAGNVELSREERTLQGRWIHAASRAIWRVAVLSGCDTVRVGICAPGIKTPDGRGIEAALHGPRIPDFLDALEQSLVLDGLNLAEPIARIVSDGLACGMGEELAEDGAFADIRDGYYAGGGTGVAEAYKLAGRLRCADALADDLPKAWQLQARDGRSFEAHLSASGINRDFGLEHGRAAEGATFPEEAAAAGQARALELFRARAESLAELCASRLLDVHAAHDLVLQRIVIGQRLGQLFLDPRLEACFAAPARAALCEQLQQRAPAELRSAWIAGGALAHGRLRGSKLRAAAALGALALALEND